MLAESIVIEDDQSHSYGDAITRIEEVMSDQTIARDVTGLHVLGRGQAHFSASTLAISAQSASNVYPVEDDWPQLTAGISIFGPGIVTTAETTALTVEAQSTGVGTTPTLDWNESVADSIDKNNFAGFVAGINAEGGTFDLKGNTTVTARGDGAYVMGISLQALAGDSEWVREHYEELSADDFSTTATFGGDLIVSAESNTSGAEAIRLGGYVPGEGDEDGTYAYPEGVKVVMNTSTTGTTTITATTNSQTHESVGVNFVYPDAEGDNPIDTPEEFTTGRGYLNLNGTTVIQADHALKGDVGYVTNKGNLTLNGRVDQFKGEFTQTADGNTVLNDSRFFGGKVTVEGGTLKAESAAWNNGEALSVKNASINLGSITVSQGHQLTLSEATVTTRYLNVNDQTELDANGSSFELNGSDDEDSRIGGQITGIKEMVVNGGTLDLVEDARLTFVDGGKLIFNDGALFSVAGNMEGGDLIFNDGTYLYEARPEVDHELLIESGNVTFNGTVGLLTGEAPEGTDMTFENAERMKTLAIGPNDSGNEPDPNVTFNGGTYAFDSAAAYAGTLTFTGEKGDVEIGEMVVKGGNIVIGGGEVAASTLTFGDNTNGKLVINGGMLTTSTDQIFVAGLGDAGTVSDPQGLKNEGRIDFTAGTLAFNDAFYNDKYVSGATGLIGASEDLKIVFNGSRVDLPQGGDVSLDEIEDNKNVVQGNVNVTISVNVGSVTIDKSFGVSTITTNDIVKDILIAADKVVTLVGGKDADGNSKEVISFGGGLGEAVKVEGTLALGQDGSVNNEGTLSTVVTVEKQGTLAVNSGNFSIENVTLSQGKVEVSGGKVDFGHIIASEGSIAVSEKGQAAADKITAGGEVTLTGALTAGEIALEAEKTATINIGTTGDSGKAGVLKLLGKTLAGISYFLDPVYVDGQTVDGASSLAFEGTTVDGRVVAGENSYVVLGTSDDSALKEVFNKGTLTWGDKDGQVLAAAYVAGPVKIDATAGGLKVDGTVNQNSGDKTVATGTVVFASNSALVADVSGITANDQPLITADVVSVAEGAKAVLIGDIKQSIGYQLTSDTQQNQNWAGNVIAGNGMWKLDMTDGVISATLQDAQQVYGSAMQGAALANAGMQAAGAEYDYVNALLTDASGNISALPSIAERFDAAMNPAGALTSFTTAYDRANELRRVVRDESVKGQGSRLWAQVTGSVTKLDGISSGGRSIDTETNAYGLVVGGEVEFSDYMLGAAFTGGTGHTDNDAVSGRDDFNYYGLSFYGKASVGGFTLLGDVSATWLRSDLSIGGAADVDTDTTTTVYSLGVQGEKTFELSWADLTPFIGVDVYHVRSDGFDNGHGAKIDDSDATAVEIPIGVRLSKSIETTGGFHMAPSFRFAVVPTVADTEIDSKVRFAGAESTYNFTFADDVKVRADVGLDAVKDNFSFGLRAGYEWGNEERSSMNMQLRAKYAF